MALIAILVRVKRGTFDNLSRNNICFDQTRRTSAQSRRQRRSDLVPARRDTPGPPRVEHYWCAVNRTSGAVGRDIVGVSRAYLNVALFRDKGNLDPYIKASSGHAVGNLFGLRMPGNSSNQAIRIVGTVE